MLIEHERLGQPLDVTFRHMLIEEFRNVGEPEGCRVYGRQGAPGTHIYYFSPAAYDAMRTFVDFWQGYPCHEPRVQAGLEVIV